MFRRLFSRRMSYTARATRDRWAVVFAAEDAAAVVTEAEDIVRVAFRGSPLMLRMAAIRKETGR